MSQIIDVILVDENDTPVGKAEKLDAHVRGLLHRAFSVFLYNEKGELLLQRRAQGKYHSPGLWANTCCGHPYLNEGNEEAAYRRLFEELGARAPLSYRGHVRYELPLADGLIEHELTHLFEGAVEANSFAMSLNPDEIMEITWMTPEAIRAHARAHPELYAKWFLFYLDHHYEKIFGPAAISLAS